MWSHLIRLDQISSNFMRSYYDNYWIRSDQLRPHTFSRDVLQFRLCEPFQFQHTLFLISLFTSTHRGDTSINLAPIWIISRGSSSLKRRTGVSVWVGPLEHRREQKKCKYKSGVEVQYNGRAVRAEQFPRAKQSAIFIPRACLVGIGTPAAHSS